MLCHLNKNNNIIYEFEFLRSFLAQQVLQKRAWTVLDNWWQEALKEDRVSYPCIVFEVMFNWTWVERLVIDWCVWDKADDGWCLIVMDGALLKRKAQPIGKLE